MNYLAHLYLADPTPESLIGNLMGDFLKGTTPAAFSEGVQAGIRRHFQVDRYTDSHPVVLESKRRISPERRRYAGVLVDVFYDHFLAQQWPQRHPEPLHVFTGRFYRILQEAEPWISEPLRQAAPVMIRYDWLGAYARIEGIDAVLGRMGRRLKRENNLGGGIEELLREYEALEDDFNRFFPDLVAHIHNPQGRETSQPLHRHT